MQIKPYVPPDLQVGCNINLFQQFVSLVSAYFVLFWSTSLNHFHVSCRCWLCLTAQWCSDGGHQYHLFSSFDCLVLTHFLQLRSTINLSMMEPPSHIAWMLSGFILHRAKKKKLQKTNKTFCLFLLVHFLKDWDNIFLYNTKRKSWDQTFFFQDVPKISALTTLQAVVCLFVA